MKGTLFHLGLGTLFTHELDAVANHEWRVLPLLCRLPDDAGMVVFVIAPSLQSGSLRKAILLGAFFGLVTYATYDLTNHATVKNWPWIVTIIDLCWGAVLAAIVSSIGYLAGRWLEGS